VITHAANSIGFNLWRDRGRLAGQESRRGSFPYSFPYEPEAKYRIDARFAQIDGLLFEALQRGSSILYIRLRLETG
jgi:hypothetical protein